MSHINVLVVDTHHQSSALLKSLLLGQRLGVSTSTDLDEAHSKLETGLFDLVCMDISKPNNEQMGFLNSLRKSLPQTPVITITDKDTTELKCLSSFKIIEKPLYLSRVINLLKEEIKYLNDFKEGKTIKKAIALPAEIVVGKNRLRCQTANLSLKGALVGADLEQNQDSDCFHSFFHKKIKDVVINLAIKDDKKVKLSSRLVFTEKTPQDIIRNAGFLFTQLKKTEQEILETLLTSVA